MTLLVTNMTRIQICENCLWDGLQLVILYDTFSASFCSLLSFDHAQKYIVLIDNGSLTVMERTCGMTDLSQLLRPFCLSIFEQK